MLTNIKTKHSVAGELFLSFSISTSCPKSQYPINLCPTLSQTNCFLIHMASNTKLQCLSSLLKLERDLNTS